MQSKYEVALLEVSVFQTLAKTEVTTFRPTKIVKRPLLYLILAAQASNFYQGFYYALDIQSKSKGAKSVVSCCFFIEKCGRFLECRTVSLASKGLKGEYNAAIKGHGGTVNFKRKLS